MNNSILECSELPYILTRQSNSSFFPVFLPGIGCAARTIRAVRETHLTKLIGKIYTGNYQNPPKRATP